MKNLFFLILIPLIALPAKSITWNEFWRPINRYERYNRYSNYNYNYNRPICTRRVNKTEYGPGYSRSWSEDITVPCYGF